MKNISRRTFSTAVVALPLQALLLPNASAAEMLATSDPMAVALGYVEATTIPEQKCSNCQLYQGEEGSKEGPCAIFPGKLVASEGWCKSWIVKAA